MKIIQRAEYRDSGKAPRPRTDGFEYGRSLIRSCAIIEIDGTRFFSLTPDNDGQRDAVNKSCDAFAEAITFNSGVRNWLDESVREAGYGG